MSAKKCLQLRAGGGADQDFREAEHTAPPPAPTSVEPWRLVTVADWAAALQVSVPTVERLRSGGRIPPPDLYLGRRLPRWRVRTVRAWLEGGDQT
ncbi:MAG: helix-turn-helix transcriptional regulator [Isosphaerales bacterium]